MSRVRERTRDLDTSSNPESICHDYQLRSGGRILYTPAFHPAGTTPRRSAASRPNPRVCCTVIPACCAARPSGWRRLLPSPPWLLGLLGLLGLLSICAMFSSLSSRLEVLHSSVHHMTNGGKQLFANEGEIKSLLRRELQLYDADKTGRSDLALESAGGRVLSTRSTRPYYLNSLGLSWLWGFLAPYMRHSGHVILQPSVLPGECWAFVGDLGEAVVRLVAPARLLGLALEHTPTSLAPSGQIFSAPRDFSLWGLENEHDDTGFLLGEYVFDRLSAPLQEFAVQHEPPQPYQLVLLRVTSNWGNPDYTCVYRLRVYGTVVADSSAVSLSGT